MMSLLSGDCVSHNQKKRESTSSNASSYLLLLNSLANDLDCMLNELCSPADDYQRSDVFLEPYLQQHGTVSEVDGSPDTPPPNPLMQHQLAHLHHVQSSESLSSEGESSAHGTSAAESSASHSDSGSEVACDITLIERLIRSHPIWFLPGIQRAGAFHLLQGKEEGNFVVRQSSQSDTMALSVRLPAGKGPYIEHYLIQANKGKLSLETSDNRFDNIPSLIAHYSQCCDELPVQLTLPRAMREAKNRQQLSSLALLGQEFWRYPMANPKPPESGGSSSNASSLGSFNTGNDPIAHDDNNIISSRDKSIILNLIPITSQDSSHSIKSVTTSTFVTSQQPRLPRPTPPNTLNLKRFIEPLDEKNERIENVILPCEKPSQKLVSPNLVQSIRCRSPVVHNVESNVLIPTESKLNNESQNLIKNINSNSPNLINANSPNSQSGDTTRNIVFESQESAGVIQINNIKTPPTPPPRWAKPGASQCQNSNVTVTTTTTVISLNVNQIGNGTGDSFQQVVTSSDKSVTMLSPQSITSNKSFSSNFTSRSTLSPSTPTLLSPSSKLVSTGRKTPNLLSPTTPSSTNKSRRRRDREARKNSQHYQESDILESYCRSSPADKISDYEDIWNTTDRSNSSWSPHDRSENTLSPSQPSENLIKDPFAGTDRVMLLRNDRSSRSREKLSYMEIASPEFSSFKPIAESCSKSPRGSTSPEDIGGIPKRPDLLSRVCSANSLNSPNVTAITPVKNKLALMFTKSESNSPMTPESKQSSPFYAEPADAIQQIQPLVPRRKNRNNSGITSKYRHSEPGWFQMPGGNNPHQMHPIDWTESEEIEDKIPLISSSVDNLTSNRLGGKENKKIYPRAKPVQPPKVKPKISNDTSWTVDSSWEFIGNEGDDTGGSEAERRGGENENEDDKKDKYSSESDRSQGKHKSPKLNGNGNRHGSDNKSDVIKTENETDFEDSPEFMSDILLRQFPRDSYNKDDGTNSLTVQSIIFQRYPELIKTTNATDTLQSNYNNSTLSNIEKRKIRETTPSDWEADRTYEPSEWETNVDTDDSDHERLKRKASFKERLDPLLSPPRLQALKNRDASGTGSSIRAYALLLAADKTTVFSQNIDNFIQCTMEGKEASPHVVMRNIRQFMSGMKNYLVKHGEREFEKEVEKERLKLKANEFLNLDAILEGVMMRLVVRPLREHVYKLFVEHYGATGSLNTLADSIQYAHGKHIQELGVRATIIPPSDNNLNLILKYIERLQKSDSPLDKLENLLSAISTIFNSVKHSNCDKHVTLGADDLLPLLVWVLVRGKVVDAEIEAEFMWGLLHPSLLTGEGGYYLTTLSSAVHVLKTFKTSQGTMSTTNGCGTPECCSSVLRVLVPDEIHGSLNTRTLPVRPNMNTREICRILAHKTRCTNPQDYGLYKLVQGEETLLGDQECPQELSHCLFAFKRIDAKIAWPKTTS